MNEIEIICPITQKQCCRNICNMVKKDQCSVFARSLVDTIETFADDPDLDNNQASEYVRGEIAGFVTMLGFSIEETALWLEKLRSCASSSVLRVLDFNENE